MSINIRIQKMIDELYHGSRRGFSKSLGVPSMTIQNICGDRGTEPSFGLLQKIVVAHPQINPMWIMSGEGDMYIANTPKVKESPPPDYGFDAVKVLQGYLSQQETIERLSRQLNDQIELVKAKQVIIDELRMQNELKDSDLRFKDAVLKQKSTIPASGGDKKQAG